MVIGGAYGKRFAAAAGRLCLSTSPCHCVEKKAIICFGKDLTDQGFNINNIDFSSYRNINFGRAKLNIEWIACKSLDVGSPKILNLKGVGQSCREIYQEFYGQGCELNVRKSFSAVERFHKNYILGCKNPV